MAARRKPEPVADAGFPRSAAGLVIAALLVALALLAPRSARAEGEPTGILSVTASVPDAQVYIDGEPVGRTPLTRLVPVGSHRVRVVADYHDPFVRKVQVSPDFTTRVEATLLEGQGTVEFFVEPKGATVLVDDQEVGPAPIRIRRVSEGDHSYRIEAEGYETKEGTFTFYEGRNILLHAELRSSEGLFVVESEPAGATVYFDGWEAGATPLELEDIPRGIHHVRISHPDHADVFRTVDTRDGSKGEVYARMSDRGARVRIRTGHPEAVVSIGGNPVGTGKKVVVDSVERGTYSFTIAAPEHETARRTVDVPPRGRVTLRAHLARADTRDHSELAVQKPLLRRWVFWAGVGGVAAVGGSGGYLAWLALRPPEPPEGDVVVEVP